MPSNQKHRILLYHRIVPDDCPRSLIAMLGGELVTQRIFHQQLLWLQKHYQIVDIETLLANGSSTRPMAAITFDDGLADNLHLALPVLQQLSIPATIFVIFGSIGDTNGFHYHRVARFLSREGMHLDKSIVDHSGNPRVQLQAVISHLAEFPDGQLAKKLTEFCATCRDDRFLDDDEVRQLDREGISIQSHTVSHTPLSKITGEALASELLDSKLGLEQLLGKPVNYLAYPVGREADFNASSLIAASAAGYSAAFTAQSGVVNEQTDRWAIPRVGTRNSTGRLRRKLRPWFSF